LARAPFSIFSRKGSDGRAAYCARFFDDDGSVIKTMVIREAKSPTAAARIAAGKLREGVIAKAKNPDALDFFRKFWTRESDYVRGRALRGIVLSDQYLKISQYLIEKHLSAALKGKRLLEVSPAFLEKTILDLSKKGASPRTINTAVQAIKVPYAHFCKLHRLANPLATIEKVRESYRERGILSAAEVGKIIALEKESPRVVAAVLLGALCGLRLGEVRGLQWEDVDADAGMIHVRHNIVDEAEGVKGPKWGSVRYVPAPQPVIEALKLCADTAPEGNLRFILWNEKRADAPILSATIRKGFKRILKKIGIDDAERERRNLQFHGLRHTFVSLSRAGGVPDFVVQRMAGHKTMMMTDRYSHAEGVIDFAAAREAMEKAVGRKKQGRQAVGGAGDESATVGSPK
jgi:integrase